MKRTTHLKIAQRMPGLAASGGAKAIHIQQACRSRMLQYLAPGLAVLTMLAVTACDRRGGEFTALADGVIVGPEYSASKGLFVPEETRRSLGLELADLTEQKIPTSLDFPLRVYRVSGDTSFASGQLAPRLQAMRLQPGQELRVRTREGRELPAKVATLTPQPRTAGSFHEILVEIAGSAAAPAGTFVTAMVTLDPDEAAAAVPRSALVESTEGSFVYTVSGDHFVRTPVEVGARNADTAEITGGLYAGDQVVARGAMALWLTELAAIKGGHACCIIPPKGK